MKGQAVSSFIDATKYVDLAGHDLPWLKMLRQNATHHFMANGLPTKQEDWRYTSVRALAQQAFNHHPPANTADSAQIEQLALLAHSHRLVILDGVFSAHHSCLGNLPVGVEISSLSANIEHTANHLGQQIDNNKVGFNALNTALMNDGTLITIKRDVYLDTPIEIIAIQTGATARLATHLRHLIVLEQNAKASVLEHYIGLTDAISLTNVVTEVSLAADASLTHYKLQQESDNAFHIATLAAKQAANSRWHTYNIALGARLARNDIHSQLLGAGAHVGMDGLYLPDNKQHIDNHIRIDHLVAHTSSQALYKGVLTDNSRGVFNGKVIVHQDAQQTDAKQYNHNLLLSSSCEIDTKPEMEIYADDVKCGHGSTVGQLNDDHIFFLRSRGVSEATAHAILTGAFVAQVLTNIAQQPIYQALSAAVDQCLTASTQ